MMYACKKLLAPVIILFLGLVTGCSGVDERVKSESLPAASEKSATEKKQKEPVKVKNEIQSSEKKESVAGVEAVKTVDDVSTESAGVMSSIYLGSDGKMAGAGDPNKPVSEAYRIGMGKRPAALAAAGLPRDKFGLVDWVAVVEKGAIKPLGSLDPGKAEIPPFEMDVVIHAKGDFVNDVVFPHNSHTYWLSCENCHPAIFVMGKGKNKMSMVEISQGKWCGECHGSVAFPLTDCSRCHTKKKEQDSAARN